MKGTVMTGMVMSVLYVLMYLEFHHRREAASHQQQESLLKMATPLQCPSYK